MSDWISYGSLMNDIIKFRASGTKKTAEFNLFDTPGQKYFKIFFYFNNGDSEYNEDSVYSSGLLAPTWMLDVKEPNYYMYNSAWSYLKMNFEDERAQLLEQFISLLSNINIESPWYFTEITGIDAALERKQTFERDFKFEEQRKKISIKCLHDSFDDRIGTLLDLYRSIVWSWTHKKEILPANLRKFDMGIFVFDTPTAGFHTDYIFPFASSTKRDFENPEKGAQVVGFSSFSTNESGPGEYKSSYKYIEFHNCEIDYNSSKANFGTISNATGVNPEYVIDILFDDCYETRYNEFMLREIGDFIIQDLHGIPDYGIEYDEDSYRATYSNNSYTHDEVMLQKLASRIHYFEPGGRMYELRDEYASQKEYRNLGIPPSDPTIIGKLNNWPEYMVQNDNIDIENPDNATTAVKSISPETEIIPSRGNDVDLKPYKGKTSKKGFLENALDQLKGTGQNILQGLINKVVLGNIFTISPSRLADQIKDAKNGNIWSTIRAVDDYVEHFTSHDNGVKYVKDLGNIGDVGNKYDNNNRYEHNIDNHNNLYNTSNIKYVNNIGHLYEANTLVNNI